MTAKERDKIIREMMESDLELLMKKGHDYSTDNDCLANLREWGFKGVVIRIADKYSRLKSFVKQGELKVNDEGVLDTLIDMSNYCYLARILYNQEREREWLKE